MHLGQPNVSKISYDLRMPYFFPLFNVEASARTVFRIIKQWIAKTISDIQIIESQPFDFTIYCDYLLYLFRFYRTRLQVRECRSFCGVIDNNKRSNATMATNEKKKKNKQNNQCDAIKHHRIASELNWALNIVSHRSWMRSSSIRGLPVISEMALS